MKRIALCLNLGHHYLQRCLHGVRETAAAHGEAWIFHHLPPTAAGVERLQEWRPDGVFASAPDRQVGRLLEALPMPVVHLGNRHVAPHLPQVGPDHHGIGRLAADHFHERGLRFLAFIGWPGQPFSDARGLGFQERLAELGLPLLRHGGGRRPAPGQDDRPPEEGAVLTWLRSLPSPVGILAANDYLAWQVAELARQAGLRIPEDIALLGADDDPLVGGLIHLPLSSVQVSARHIGQEATRMLIRLLVGDAGPRIVEIAPTGVMARASTDLTLLADPLVREAVKAIAACAGRDLTVELLTRRLRIPRRTLERRFIQVLGRTILAEIQRVRLEQAKILLTTSDLAITDISRRAGFGSPTHFTAVFKTHCGLTPSRYRDHHGA
jgi:LacI family transcriptional regulator